MVSLCPLKLFASFLRCWLKWRKATLFTHISSLNPFYTKHRNRHQKSKRLSLCPEGISNLVGKETMSSFRKALENQVDPAVLRVYKNGIIWMRWSWRAVYRALWTQRQSITKMLGEEKWWDSHSIYMRYCSLLLYQSICIKLQVIEYPTRSFKQWGH